MGFISNQWLNRGYGLRTRKYNPVPVNISACTPSDAWSQQKEVRVEVIARRASNEYQTLHLTRAEAEKAAESILDACSPEVKAKVVLKVLRQLSDSELIRLLAADLKSRTKST